VLLDALPLIWKTVPEAQLKAVVQNVKWEEEYAVSIRRRLQGLPRDKILLDSGRRDRAEIKRLIAEAAVVVVPEQWENMSPLLVMEAMLAGTPVVASRIGGIPEFIRDGIEGLLAAPDNPAEFAGKIVSLLRDEKAAAAFGGRAVTRARELLDPEALSDRLIKEYSLCATR
jgi:glycosyltransferase involved in cell wall biosynthesis